MDTTVQSATEILKQMNMTAEMKSYSAWKSLKQFIESVRCPPNSVIIVDFDFIDKNNFDNLFIAPFSAVIKTDEKEIPIDQIPTFITLNKSDTIDHYHKGDSIVINPRPIVRPAKPLTNKKNKLIPTDFIIYNWQFMSMNRNADHDETRLSVMQKQILKCHGFDI